MLRLRVPGRRDSPPPQLRGLADIAADWGGGYAHITTRANLQIREFRPRDIIKVLIRLQELGLTSRGAGADNIRNITASPNSGFDPDELIDVRPYAKGLHHYILNHRDLYGLPRKFNVAFDNGGSHLRRRRHERHRLHGRAASPRKPRSQPSTPLLPPSNRASISASNSAASPGTGDFARDTGLLIKPGEAVAVAAAMIRVFNENGDRTNRKKARLKYLLEKWGVEKFLAETADETRLPARPPAARSLRAAPAASSSTAGSASTSKRSAASTPSASAFRSAA